jgi:hypothetical protein
MTCVHNVCRKKSVLQQNHPNLLILMVGVAGLEPATR